MRRSRSQAGPPAQPTPKVVEAPGVEYFELKAAPGLKMFGCAPLRARLTMEGCAKRWREAQDAPGDVMAACRSCPTGAAHAGARHVQHSVLFGAAICPRCRRGATRMIHNRRCVTCYNRQREMKAGKNARGNKPVELLQAPLHTVEFMKVLDGRPRRARFHEVRDMSEAMIQLLRITKGDLAFGYAGPHTLRQGRLL